METRPGVETRVWDIGDLNRRAALAVVKEFRGPVWVAGELTKLVARTRSVWMELVERGGGRDGRDAHLRARCSVTRWTRIEARLASAGITIGAGQRLTLVGSLDVGDRGELTLALQDVDVAALVGERALARQRLRERLAADGLIDANRRLALPPLPLRIGVVASAGSDGHGDLIRQLDGSGFAFAVTLRAVSVEGPTAARSVKAALATFGPLDVDLAVIVRGGGSKASLDVFDSATVAHAVATAAVPVWTGIGHTGDRTVADEVAHRCCTTPTEVGQALVARVAEAWDTVVRATARIDRLARTSLTRAGADLDTRQRQLSTVVRSQLELHRQLQAQTAAALWRAASRSLDDRGAALTATARRARSGVERQLDASRERLGTRRALLAAFDPGRQLDRGWTLTRTGDGRLVRRVSVLTAGDSVVTTFADGTVTSTVTDVAPAEEGS